MDTPSQILTGKIVQRLIDAKILREDDARVLIPKIAAGKLTQDDWRLAVEKALEKEAKK
jgi:hypothetical protein